MSDAIKVPSPGESDHGIALEPDQLRLIIQGFKRSVLFPIVYVAASIRATARTSPRAQKTPVLRSLRSRRAQPMRDIGDVADTLGELGLMSRANKSASASKCP
jgi:hypothetical protein